MTHRYYIKPVSASASVLLLLGTCFLIATSNLEAKRSARAAQDTTYFYEDIRTEVSGTTPDPRLAGR
ncbi:MAG: hypothetical protein M3N12_08625 [Verrucomicrobiota bacterium]|nr:hypothetical protein [Verrucomicrobiota bacterium]